MSTPRRLGSSALAAILLATASASAQSADAASAVALFKDGRDAAKRGDYAAACPKFAESLRLDPATGTLINLADCEEHVGRLASAWQHYSLAAEKLASDDERVPLVTKRIDALSRRLPKLTIVVAADSPSDTSVSRDSIDLGAGSLRTALPVDPGEHTIVASAAGRAKKIFTISLREGETRQIEVSAGPPLQATTDSAEPKPSASSPLRTIGFVSLGIGVVAVGGAVGTGVALMHDHDVVRSGCPTKTTCTQDGYDAAQRGKTLVPLNTAAWIVGALGVGAGVTMIAVGSRGPKSAPTSARLVILPGGAAIEGAF